MGDARVRSLRAGGHRRLANRRHDLLLLYQLSIKLLGCDEPDEVMRVALELLRDRTHASVVGFLVGRRRRPAEAQAA